MQQNYSPRWLALITSGFCFVCIVLITYWFFGYWLNSLISGAIISVVVYIVIWYYVQQVVDKKINTIYKLINQTKSGRREAFYKETLLPKPTLHNVTTDVATWAKNNAEAFALHEKNEQYRKEFLQNLSHELKTPLFSMQGYIESLLDGALYNNKVNKTFLQNTANNIYRLTDLVNDLDQITKLENDQIPVLKTTFIISDEIENVYNSVALQAQAKNINLLFKNTLLKNTKVLADASKINQVLVNLITNAIKYGKPNGKVTANIEIINNTTVLVEITDNGYGIAKEHLGRIFERFYRTDFARERVIGGSGLGLAICKHIIEAHGQNIHVRSTINVGTTFGFSLPRVK